jgi:hypothetical protein
MPNLNKMESSGKKATYVIRIAYPQGRNCAAI